MSSQLNCLEAELNERLEGVVMPEMCDVREQCIHIIQPRLRQLNPKAYTPQVFSIGPFHNPFCGPIFEDNNMLKPMEEIKLRYFKGFLYRTQLRVADFLSKLKEWESRIRSYYAGGVINSYTSNNFLKMIMIDACFIIEHFIRYFEISEWIEHDPLLLSTSMLADIRSDLILLENQLPFFVLEEIYNLTHINHKSPSFVEITLHYFQDFNLQEKKHLEVCPKHLTDLIRILFLPPDFKSDTTKNFLPRDFKSDTTKNEIGQVYSASQLSEAGLVFKAGGSHCLLDLYFEKGVLTMPFFIIQDSTEVYFRNILAYEEYHHPSSPHITHYISFLDDLIITEKDVSILVDKKILVNFMGDVNSVATLVKDLCKNLYLQGFNSKLLSICHNLNYFYEDPVSKYKATFMPEYFNTPVKIVSTIAAVLLLFLTYTDSDYIFSLLLCQTIESCNMFVLIIWLPLSNFL